MYVAILSGAATIPGFALHYEFGNKMKGADVIKNRDKRCTYIFLF